MKNSFGNNVIVTLFGESHGEYIGATLDGLSAGVEIDEEYIKREMQKRMPQDDISTERRESDEVKIISGVLNGFSTGAPITVLIKNEKAKSSDYDLHNSIPRPSHADFTAYCKYHGYGDARGGGHLGGRITAALVAVGSICKKALEAKGITVGTHIKSIHGVFDRDFENLKDDIAKLNEMQFAVLSDSASGKMKAEIKAAKQNGDSVGGILESAVCGIECGVGEPWFDTFEGMLSHMLFSIPAVKGVSFGDGFSLCEMFGSEANDSPVIENGKVKFKSNHSGGINGGITNGMPVVFSVAIKPTPSIAKEQDTVDLSSGENTKIKIIGRHDPCIVHRARAVVDAATAIVLCDLLETKYGSDYFCGERK